jgi:hypothetical protein
MRNSEFSFVCRFLFTFCFLFPIRWSLFHPLVKKMFSDSASAL